MLEQSKSKKLSFPVDPMHSTGVRHLLAIVSTHGYFHAVI